MSPSASKPLPESSWFDRPPAPQGQEDRALSAAGVRFHRSLEVLAEQLNPLWVGAALRQPFWRQATEPVSGGGRTRSAPTSSAISRCSGLVFRPKRCAPSGPCWYIINLGFSTRPNCPRPRSRWQDNCLIPRPASRSAAGAKAQAVACKCRKTSGQVAAGLCARQRHCTYAAWTDNA